MTVIIYKAFYSNQNIEFIRVVLFKLFPQGIVLGTLFAGGYLMSGGEITAGDLMSFLVASQTIERYPGFSLLYR